MFLLSFRSVSFYLEKTLQSVNFCQVSSFFLLSIWRDSGALLNFDQWLLYIFYPELRDEFLSIVSDRPHRLEKSFRSPYAQ